MIFTIIIFNVFSRKSRCSIINFISLFISQDSAIGTNKWYKGFDLKFLNLEYALWLQHRLIFHIRKDIVSFLLRRYYFFPFYKIIVDIMADMYEITRFNDSNFMLCKLKTTKVIRDTLRSQVTTHQDFPKEKTL